MPSLFTWHCLPLRELPLWKDDNPLTNGKVTAIETKHLLCKVYNMIDDIASGWRDAQQIANQADPPWRF